MKNSTLTLSKPKAILLELVLLYGKIKDTDKSWYTRCVTCGAYGLWYIFSGGHFIAQSKGQATKYELDNVNCQCTNCNKWEDDQGRQNLHGFYIDQKYGQGRADELRQLSNQVKSRSLSELETAIDHVTNLIIKKFLSFTKSNQVRFLLYIKKGHRKTLTKDLYIKLQEACQD